MHRLIKSMAAIAVLGGCAAIGGSVAMASTPISGSVQVWATIPNNGNSGTFPVLLTGAVGDYGNALNANASGQVVKGQKDGYKLFVLKHGSILLNGKNLNAALNNPNTPPTTQNNTTCSATFVVTEPVPVVKGTKAYAGITGSITVTVSFAELGPKNKNGSCNESNNAKPVSTYGSVTGTGSVSYG